MMISGNCALEKVQRDMLEELYKREKEFIWHDLRNNPDDLPDEGEVNVCLDGKYGNVTFDKGISSVYYCSGHFFNDHELNKLVIGWKYIEPFAL